MSSALVRQALALVDPEEVSSNKSNKRKSGPQRRRRAVQDPVYPFKRNKKQASKEVSNKEKITEENIRKLLALSTPTAGPTISEKIVERAVKGRPVADKIEIKVEEQKSILFPDEEFKQFEEELFCSEV